MTRQERGRVCWRRRRGRSDDGEEAAGSIIAVDGLLLRHHCRRRGRRHHPLCIRRLEGSAVSYPAGFGRRRVIAGGWGWGARVDSAASSPTRMAAWIRRDDDVWTLAASSPAGFGRRRGFARGGDLCRRLAANLRASAVGPPAAEVAIAICRTVLVEPFTAVAI
uniref:Uncharacterized protein n=1 Tax=Oryza sativa subsp. japonica TaxID=39947 RepID=Q67UM9_ORYSJ|nr:hypothetical protein [Oryza sativa Japonica Group]